MVYTSTYQASYDPVFPASPLDAEVDLYVGSWTPITTKVYQRDPMVITRGRPNQSSQVNPSQMNLTLNNRDNRFTINNPTGLYYGLLNRNAPLRASIPTAMLPAPYNTAYLRMEDDAVSFASCPAAARIELTGSLDIRVDAHPSGYGVFDLASLWGASATVNQRAWNFLLEADGTLLLGYTTSGALATVAVGRSTAQLPVGVGRQCFRATLDATTGNISFYTAAPGNIATGPWTQVGSTIAGSGAVTVFASTTTGISIGYSPGRAYDNASIGLGVLQGAVYDFELRNGIGGTVVAKPAFNTQPPGATLWQDAPGNFWSVSGSAAVTARDYRYHGELSATPKAVDPTVTDVYSQATASGVLRRLQQAQEPLSSPMYRAVTNAASAAAQASPAVAYWPCEDPVGATQLASGLSGGAAMTIVGTPTLASSTAFTASGALPALNGGTLSGAVNGAGSAWAGNLLGFLLEIPAGGETNGAVVARFYTTGTFARIDVVYASASGGSLGVNCYSASDSLLTSASGVQYTGLTGGTVGVNGVPALIEVSVFTQSGNLKCELDAAVPLAPGSGGNIATGSGTVGAVSRVTLNPNGTLTGTAMGHVFVCAGADNTPEFTSPNNGPLGAWLGEPAGIRVQRLCAEEGLRARVVGHPNLSASMGSQTSQTLSFLLQECEDTDRGMLCEPRTCLGVGYRTAVSMYNQAPVATASYTAAALAQGVTPTCDDLYTVNDVTVSNADGSSARQVLASGALSVQAPPNGVGQVSTSVSVNAAYDGHLASTAQWILHVSTDTHDRFEVIPFNMARPQTPASVALLDWGDLLAVTNSPAWVQPDEIDQLAAGFTETLGPFGVWEIDVNGLPAYPYTVAVAAPTLSSAPSFTGSGQFAIHADTDGTTLTAFTSATATSMTFASLANYPAWTTSGQDFPFDVNIAGERVTVIGPGGCIGIDPFLASGAADYSAQNGAVTLTTALGAPGVMTGYSQSALLLTPTGGGPTYAELTGTVTANGSILTNTAYTLWAWVYATAGRTYSLVANWSLNGVYVSTSETTGVTVAAAGWTFLTGSVTSPASGINSGQLGVVDNGSPTSGQTFGVIGLNGAPSVSIVATSPQPFTVARSVNGVVKSQLAGASVALWYTPVAGQNLGS